MHHRYVFLQIVIVRVSKSAESAFNISFFLMVSSHVIIKSLLIFFCSVRAFVAMKQVAKILSFFDTLLALNYIISYHFTLNSPPQEPIHKQMIHNYQLNLKELDFNRFSLSVTQTQSLFSCFVIREI